MENPNLTIDQLEDLLQLVDEDNKFYITPLGNIFYYDRRGRAHTLANVDISNYDEALALINK
jgi:hypothetical protein